jgi:predicted DNA-binding transcriptional regulator AlpA
VRNPVTEPLYMSKKTLAAAIDCAESTVDELVRNGVIPQPVRWSTHCVRWRWADVDAALKLYGARIADDDDEGVRNAREPQEGRRRGAS